ncbi:FAD-dependent oxidoreductase [Vibrio sp. S11_S32]|uniref:NAD(P)/FAD-dependent oxidoreductase n=1 Tax=Vibrio sp. S11_S32 TaxID=2720225 RepID=UPI001680F7E8|nr:FAD-dependent oxidoreductase [Vibrio sp. S11_S32]MBD1577037.1 FAD-dependent oxidoreductase [Vibrio sp. S11_S32]
MKKNIVIIGAGFAGMWAALSAARLVKLQACDDISITVMAPKAELRVRPRFYESKVRSLVSPLMPVFGAMGIQFQIATVQAIQTEDQCIEYIDDQGALQTQSYDKLVLAAGSNLNTAMVKGIQEYAFDLDQIESATVLEDHLNNLSNKPYSGARNTVVVCGGGFTGIEIATELPARLKSQLGEDQPIDIIVVERSAQIGANYSQELQQVIKQASDEVGITWKLNTQIDEITQDGLRLSSGEKILSDTVIWTAGVKANELTNVFEQQGPQGRLNVSSTLEVEGVTNIYATGDVAYAATDDKGNHALMSCQHAILMGKFASNNVAASLLGCEKLPYRQEAYVTCLDLGSWGAVYTEGWEQKVQLIKEEAKKLKLSITNQLIYPPKADFESIMRSADPFAPFV